MICQLINKLAYVRFQFFHSSRTDDILFRSFPPRISLLYFSKVRFPLDIRLFSKFSSLAEQAAMYSLSASYSPSRPRTTTSPPSSPDSPRPAYSILCDETRTLMLACLRKIASVNQKNERRMEEHRRHAEQEKQTSQAAQIVSTNARDLLKRFLLKFPLIKPSPSTINPIQLKPLLPSEIVEQLNNTKNKFCELFRVSHRRKRKSPSEFVG